MTDDSLRVLYIAGWARSGSTILGHVMGQAPRTFFGGELFHLVERGWRENEACGCGRPFLECPVWAQVMDGVRRQVIPGDLELAEAFGNRILRTRHLSLILARNRSPLSPPDEQAAARVLTALYSQMQAVAGAEVIIDSSKSPVFAHVLDNMPGFELLILHLVRDPRATAFSFRRRKFDPGSGRYLQRRGLVRNALIWDVWNAAVERLWARDTRPHRYLRLRYEDFALDPAAAVRSALEFAGVTDRGLSFVDGDMVRLAPTHSATGNPSRFQVGEVPIRPDDEWRSGLPEPEKALVTLLTWPGLIHYGYPVGNRKEAAVAKRSAVGSHR